MRSSPPAICLTLFASLAPLPGLADVPSVVTDIPPVQSLAAMVMGDLGTPDVLAGNGADAHSYQLRPSQARALHQANLVFWIGPEMTPWLAQPLEGAGEARIVGLLADPATERRDFDAHDETGHDDHGKSGTDPHAWLSPGNAVAWVDLIATALAGVDAEHAATYRANAAAAKARIAAADQMVRNVLGTNAGQPIIVGHDALGYFANHYGLNIVATVTAGDAVEPGAAHLSDLAALMRGEAAVCYFPAAGADPTRYVWLTEGTPIRTGAALDPEGQTIAPGPALYPDLIEKLGKAIGDCLAGR